MLNYACFRTGSNWRQQNAASLAAAIVQPAALGPMSLMDLFQQAAAADAVVAEFATIWQYSEYVRRVETALQNGDLAGAIALLAVCPVAFSEKTLVALQTTLADNTLRLVDVVAIEQRAVAPVAVTADDVTKALNEAGYWWDGEEWSRE